MYQAESPDCAQHRVVFSGRRRRRGPRGRRAAAIAICRQATTTVLLLHANTDANTAGISSIHAFTHSLCIAEASLSDHRARHDTLRPVTLHIMARMFRVSRRPRHRGMEEQRGAHDVGTDGHDRSVTSVGGVHNALTGSTPQTITLHARRSTLDAWPVQRGRCGSPSRAHSPFIATPKPNVGPRMLVYTRPSSGLGRAQWCTSEACFGPRLGLFHPAAPPPTDAQAGWSLISARSPSSAPHPACCLASFAQICETRRHGHSRAQPRPGQGAGLTTCYRHRDHSFGQAFGATRPAGIRVRRGLDNFPAPPVCATSVGRSLPDAVPAETRRFEKTTCMVWLCGDRLRGPSSGRLTLALGASANFSSVESRP